VKAPVVSPEALRLRDGTTVSVRPVMIDDEGAIPDRDKAEVGVEVADDLHHLGLATLLIIRLAQFAEAQQIPSFFAEVLPGNLDMLAAFRDGFAAATSANQDEVEVEFPTSNWRGAKARFEPRVNVRPQMLRPSA
jgi:hypothetical protein